MEGKIPATTSKSAHGKPPNFLPTRNTKLIAVTPGITFDVASILLKSSSDIIFLFLTNIFLSSDIIINPPPIVSVVVLKTSKNKSRISYIFFCFFYTFVLSNLVKTFGY